MQIALFFVVWGITVMHRCRGVYDLGFLRVAACAPNTPPTFVFFCQVLFAHFLLQSVCGDGGATGVRDRSERDAWANPPCAPRCCYCLLSPTLFWVDGTHLPSLRWYLCMWFLSNTVWMSLLLWL
ncbi:retrotransposon hot spot (RHS) protein [Trypanosoma cruzi]|nr:retrotransposon hot spot (RHS) protein [Trypanosoma cruzi]